jgi:hypothetical protein
MVCVSISLLGAAGGTWNLWNSSPWLVNKNKIAAYGGSFVVNVHGILAVIYDYYYHCFWIIRLCWRTAQKFKDDGNN